MIEIKRTEDVRMSTSPLHFFKTPLLCSSPQSSFSITASMSCVSKGGKQGSMRSPLVAGYQKAAFVGL